METFPYGKNMDLLYVIFRYTQYQPNPTRLDTRTRGRRVQEKVTRARWALLESCFLVDDMDVVDWGLRGNPYQA